MQAAKFSHGSNCMYDSSGIAVTAKVVVLFGALPGGNCSRCSVPVTSATGIGSSGTSAHPITLGSSGRTGLSGVVLVSGSVILAHRGVRATTSTMAKLLTVAALDLAPVLRLRAVLSVMTLLLAVATEHVGHVDFLGAVTASVTLLLAVATDDDTLVDTVRRSVTLALAVAANLCRLRMCQ